MLFLRPYGLMRISLGYATLNIDEFSVEASVRVHYNRIHEGGR